MANCKKFGVVVKYQARNQKSVSSCHALDIKAIWVSLGHSTLFKPNSLHRVVMRKIEEEGIYVHHLELQVGMYKNNKGKIFLKI